MQICVPVCFISCCLMKNEPITLCLTNLYFLNDAVFKQKIFWGNSTVSQHFRTVVKMGPKPGIFFVFFLREYIATRSCKSKIVGLSAYSVRKFGTEIDNFIKFPQNGNFLDFSLDYPVQCCP